ncbi:MAG TPA: PTS sugar transporter subunit IIA [Candidatus Marinimicrobia bacterium]|nr:PTS sugar transporter subunit IIA [Candidatus Neomarinimicrobiota bacterium]
MKLTDIITQKMVIYPLQGESKEAVIREMVLHLKKLEKINDPNTIFDTIMERERIMTTGVGHHIAIPHGKSVDIHEIIVLLGLQPNGIDFDSLDKLPVHIVFLLLTSEKDKGIHIRLLSRISRLLNRIECRRALIAAQSTEDALEILRHAEEQWFEI